MDCIRIYKTGRGILLQNQEEHKIVRAEWDDFINRDDLYRIAMKHNGKDIPASVAERIIEDELLPPVGMQEVWAAGVTYYRSREARIDESREAGGGDFYDRVYSAERPELFFKANPQRIAGPGQLVRVRKDSSWNVPEPELTLMISSGGNVVGYTIGNDMSSRDIEGQNPLYLPQAKTYDRSASIGPCILVLPSVLPPETEIKMVINRNNCETFNGSVAISQMKRGHSELVGYLFRELTFPAGCLLMTGTGIIPPKEFTLNHGDEIRITVDHIGTLVNIVE